MSDERLRELERRWKETGSVADEAAFLHEMLRVDAITAPDLQLAALLDHDASRAVLGASDLPPPQGSEWEQALAAWGPGVLIRAVVALARCVSLSEEDARRLSVVEDWCCAPAAFGWRRLEPCLTPSRSSVSLATHLVDEAVRAVASALGDRPALMVPQDPRNELVAVGDWGSWFKKIAEVAGAAWGTGWRGMIGAELLPWVLKRRDPVLARCRRSQTSNGDLEEA